MSESKYAKYIITQALAEEHGYEEKDPPDMHSAMAYLDGSELWIEDERHLLTESCLVHIPAGTHHCPMRITRADRPIFHFSSGMTDKAYEREGDEAGGQSREA
jgi:hypothetical protein